MDGEDEAAEPVAGLGPDQEAGEEDDEDWVPPPPPRVTATEMMAWVTYAGVLVVLILLALDTGRPTLGVVAAFVVWALGLALLGAYARSGVLRTPEVVLHRAPLPFPYRDDEVIGQWIKAGAEGDLADFIPPPVVDPSVEGEDAGLAAYLARAEQARRRREKAGPAGTGAPAEAAPGFLPRRD